jgi:OmpA-OmpF porin, OOP family
MLNLLVIQKSWSSPVFSCGVREESTSLIFVYARSFARDTSGEIQDTTELRGSIMKPRKIWIGLCAALLCSLLVGVAYAVSNGEQVKTKGLITSRDGETLTLRTLETGNLTVVLTDTTKVVQPKGLLKVRKQDMGVTALMPGLKIQVEGIGDAQNRVVATTIKFSKDDLKTAEAIQAGLVPTEKAVQTNKENIQANKEDIAGNKVQIAANREKIDENEQEVNKRFSDLSEYDTKGSAMVYFASGSTTISKNDKDALTELGQKAVSLKGYIVQVKGFADSSGNAAMNQKLSMERAQEVIAFLLKNCNVPLRHIVAPGAMGEADPAAPNETAQGRKENRRVEVKVLVNRGVAGS